MDINKINERLDAIEDLNAHYMETSMLRQGLA